MFSFNTLSPSRRQFITSALEIFPDLGNEITKDQIQDVIESKGLNMPQWLIIPENRINRGTYGFPNPSIESIQESIQESEADISSRIKDTYDSMDELVRAVASNTVNSLVVAGGAGLGKSYTVNKVLQEVNGGDYGYVFHRGYLRATHLFRLLWENRHKGQTIVLDDCDLWHDETALNILKAALELKPVRRIGWGSEKEFTDEDGETIPRYFDYQGSVIFLTNLQIRDLINAGGKQAPHLSAIESRSLVLDLKIKTKQEYMIKIKQTLEEGMLRKMGISHTAEQEIVEFMEDNVDKLVELSLRMVEKIASLYLASDDWRKLCRTVCLK